MHGSRLLLPCPSPPPGCPPRCPPKHYLGAQSRPRLLEIQSARRQGCHTSVLFSPPWPVVKPSVPAASAEVAACGLGTSVKGRPASGGAAASVLLWHQLRQEPLCQCEAVSFLFFSFWNEGGATHENKCLPTNIFLFHERNVPSFNLSHLLR